MEVASGGLSSGRAPVVLPNTKSDSLVVLFLCSRPSPGISSTYLISMLRDTGIGGAQEHKQKEKTTVLELLHYEFYRDDQVVPYFY